MVRLLASLWIFLSINLAYANEFIKINFSAENVSSTSLLLKAVNLSLDEIGARVAFVNEYSNDPFFYSLDLWNDRNLDLNRLYQIFIRNSIKTKKANKEQNRIDFLLDTAELSIVANAVDFDNDLILDRKSSSYFINLNDAKRIIIEPMQNSEWIALVRFYDKNLNQIRKVENTTITKQLNLKIDDGVAYALIADSVDTNNIKGGLVIKFSKE